MKNNLVVKVGIFSAIAFLLQLLGSILPFKVGGFLEIEFSDIPAVIIAFAEGPVAGLLIELIKNLLHLPFSSTGFVGELANFIVNGAFVFTAGSVYKLKKTKANAAISLAASIIVLVIAAFVVNIYILLPLYMPGTDFSAKFNITAFTITPFNFVKGIILSIITMLIYKKVSCLIKK